MRAASHSSAASRLVRKGGASTLGLIGLMGLRVCGLNMGFMVLTIQGVKYSLHFWVEGCLV